MAKRWDSNNSCEIENRAIDAFLAEVLAVCGRHGFSIAHEDSHGGFLIVDLSESANKHLAEAMDCTQPCDPKSPECPECNGAGEVDSGGFTPHGHPINVPCSTCSRLYKP